MSNDSNYYNILSNDDDDDESSSLKQQEWEEISLTNHSQDNNNSWEDLMEVESMWNVDITSSSVVTHPSSSFHTKKDDLLRDLVVVDHQKSIVSTPLFQEVKKKKKKHTPKLKSTKKKNTPKSGNKIRVYALDDLDDFQMITGNPISKRTTNPSPPPTAPKTVDSDDTKYIHVIDNTLQNVMSNKKFKSR